MRWLGAIAIVLCVAALALVGCDRGEPVDTVEFGPHSDVGQAPETATEPRAVRWQPTDEAIIGPALRPVLRDWRRRSTYYALKFVRMEVVRGEIHAEWRSRADAGYAAGEVCDLMLSLNRGFSGRPIKAIHVTRHHKGGTQEIEIPGELAEAYLNVEINDPEFFGRLGLE
jgi:hypothetical protein